MSGLHSTLRRQHRVRSKLRATTQGRPRLSVFRSNKYIYAQLIDDAKGVTVASASSLPQDLGKKLKSTSDKSAAAAVGKAVAERATKAGVSDVVFDRGGCLYHGRIQFLADAARENGLKF